MKGTRGDAENKQTAVNGGSVGQYWYDGDGKRVKKYVPTSGETTVFVYDAFGKLVAEYSTNVIPASNAQVIYTTNDHLGSPRIIPTNPALSSPATTTTPSAKRSSPPRSEPPLSATRPIR
jgi:hypothetical protein